MIPNPPDKRFVVDIMDANDPTRVYLRRFHLIRTPWFGVYLHAIYLPDGDRMVHCHPWWFAPLILLGGYDEKIVHSDGSVEWAERKRGSFRFVRSRGLWHQIYRLHRTPTWTLVFRGRRERQWGYLERLDWAPADSRNGGKPSPAGEWNRYQTPRTEIKEGFL